MAYVDIKSGKNEDQSTNCFEWKDINVTIEGKQILHNVCGAVGSGQLCVILGGSGAGKSTLLNAISGRLLSKAPSHLSTYCCINKCKSSGTQVSGNIAYNRCSMPVGLNDAIKYLSAYVLQSDILCATATAQEALTFSSSLRSNKSPQQQADIIHHVIESLKLDDCKDTFIGNEALRGMSGGERKRTSVGVELVTEPELIFLDECTSGLDSFTALRTIQILKQLTEQEHKQVIATIHQPSSEIFAMIDILILLAKGHVVYYGPAKQVLSYFGSLGYECPQYVNIADYVVNQVQQHSDIFIEQWKKHQHDHITLQFNDYQTLRPPKAQDTTFWQQFSCLINREWQILLRDPRPSKIRFAQTVIFSTFVGILYYQLPYTMEGLRDRFGAIFFMTVNSSMSGLIATIIVFPDQRILFERERDSNMYYTTTWLLAKFCIGIPETALFTLIYQCIVYWLVDFDSPFFSLYISLMLCVLSTGSYGMIIGCFAKSASEAMQLLPLGFMPFLLFANFMVSLQQIPVWIRWLQWLNPFKYTVDSLAILEFHEVNPNPEYQGDEYLRQINAGYINTWGLKEIVNNYDDSVYIDWALLFILAIGFRLITWIILTARNGW